LPRRLSASSVTLGDLSTLNRQAWIGLTSCSTGKPDFQVKKIFALDFARR